MKFSSDQNFGSRENFYQVRINWSEMNFIQSHSSFSEMILEASKLVLFARKQTKRSEKIVN